jgi:hypothetical protein
LGLLQSPSFWRPFFDWLVVVLVTALGEMTDDSLD